MQWISRALAPVSYTHLACAAHHQLQLCFRCNWADPFQPLSGSRQRRLQLDCVFNAAIDRRCAAGLSALADNGAKRHLGGLPHCGGGRCGCSGTLFPDLSPEGRYFSSSRRSSTRGGGLDKILLIPASQIYRFAGKYFLNGAGAHSCLFAHKMCIRDRPCRLPPAR